MNVYEIVTDRILKQLEHGTIPWRKPWADVRAGAFNRVSKKPYSLLNQMLLSHEGEYATFRQWSSLGGHVKKGTKAEVIVFWKMLAQKGESGDDKPVKSRPILRYYNVFHISNVEGVDPLPTEPLHDTNPLENAQMVFDDYVGRERIKTESSLSNRAFYSPARDLIHLPDIRQYENASDYYSVVFHEATHSTGHRKRLSRFSEYTSIAPFGSEDYSKEELIAELGSATILNMLGLETSETFQNSSAYIQSWIGVLKNDSHFIVSASAKADKAVYYILEKEMDAA